MENKRKILEQCRYFFLEATKIQIKTIIATAAIAHQYQAIFPPMINNPTISIMA